MDRRALMLGWGLLPFVRVSAAAQAERSDLYKQVIDRLFPRVPSLKGRVLRFWLRFEPGLDPVSGVESQIEVSLLGTGGGVVEYASADRKVWDLLSEAQRTKPRVKPDQAARQVMVNRKRFNKTSAQVAKWQRGLFQAINREFSGLQDAKKVTITLDSPIYAVWYVEGDVAFQFTDSGVSENSPFVRWAKGFRSEILSAAGQAR